MGYLKHAWFQTWQRDRYEKRSLNHQVGGMNKVLSQDIIWNGILFLNAFQYPTNPLRSI